MKELKNNLIKDFKKYLTTSLQVYLFVLIVVFIIKLTGLNYFGLDDSNTELIKLDKILAKYKIDYLYQCICLYFNFYLIKCTTLQKYKIDIDTFIVPTINIVMIFIFKSMGLLGFYQVANMLLLLGYFLIKKAKFKRIIWIFIINLFCQALSVGIRNYNIQDYDNILLNAIMNIDYYIMLLILYSIEKQGGVSLCQEVGSYLPKKINLKMLLRKLQANYSNFKKQDKRYKTTIIIYFIMSLIWNILNVLLILFIASLNDTFIECIFIMTSFFITKKVFGKAFHLDSMAKCFVVSNLTYYTLNRITTPVGKYAISMDGHITAVINGTIVDTFNPSNRIIRCAWKII